MPNIIVPFGDDVSAVPLNGEVAVLKTDMLVAKTDVPEGMSLLQAARKAVVMNISDFAAKGVQPQTVLVSLGLPNDLSATDLTEIARGLNAGAREYGAYVVGGDTGEACDLIIAVQLYGTSSKKGLMLRSGARPGDILAVTGEFGKSAAGINLLQRGLEAPWTTRRALEKVVYMPEARLKEGLAMRRAKAVTSSIDSSDGLAWCLHELAQQGGVGFKVTDLPIAKEVVEFAETNLLNAIDLALYGGEEYELVFTIQPNRWDAAKSFIDEAGGKLLPIGEATSCKELLYQHNGKWDRIDSRGYEHFKNV